jgi:hypothetical protein
VSERQSHHVRPKEPGLQRGSAQCSVLWQWRALNYLDTHALGPSYSYGSRHILLQRRQCLPDLGGLRGACLGPSDRARQDFRKLLQKGRH